MPDAVIVLTEYGPDLRVIPLTGEHGPKTFDGPLGHAANAEECIAGLRRMSEIVTDIVIRKTFIDGPDVLTWFDLHTATTAPLPTVNWRHVDNGKITAIRVTFDPRPLTSGS